MQVIHDIARSRSDPERAERIVRRMEQQGGGGDKAWDPSLLPDVVCYDALINAYGWSRVPGRSRKCYDIFQAMLESYRSGSNDLAKPDIITCNSVLNAVAFEPARTSEDRMERMRLTVDAFETFQGSAPDFGWPNHLTYAHMLLSIANHMDANDARRAELAQATFWKCCASGHVSVLVVTQLHRALPWDRFRSVMGDDALFSSSDSEKLGFNLRKLPSSWTRFAPRPRHRQDSRPSQRLDPSQVTKSSLLQQQRRPKPGRRG
jgi:hypothetical protein